MARPYPLSRLGTWLPKTGKPPRAKLGAASHRRSAIGHTDGGAGSHQPRSGVLPVTRPADRTWPRVASAPRHRRMLDSPTPTACLRNGLWALVPDDRNATTIPIAPSGVGVAHAVSRGGARASLCFQAQRHWRLAAAIAWDAAVCGSMVRTGYQSVCGGPMMMVT
jgi:hypothetical protein